ncbi:hypothetical protein ACE38W_17975 [Chitinophaga sp. Hz27]|uniref:hypothetical protein n=1 Tax=Chitinophaga sp. Hz27 TaxID=3347169 RepID=UPI0035D6BCFB
MKSRILTGWNFMRWLRLGMGIAIMVQGFYSHDMQFVLIGGLLSLIPILNFGCGGGNCSVPRQRNTKQQQAVSYEEVS